MNAYKIRSIVMADGSIVLKGLPFSVGKSVEVIVLDDVYAQEAANPLDERWKSLQGSVTRYDDPFESAIPSEDWDVLK
jgi:uncharacterized membrane protein (DUF485 family)